MNTTSAQASAIRSPADRETTVAIAAAMSSLVRPGAGHIGCAETLLVLFGDGSRSLVELQSLPAGGRGQRLMALRYFIENAPVWLSLFSWEPSAQKLGVKVPDLVRKLASRVEVLRAKVPKKDAFEKKLEGTKLSKVYSRLGDDFLGRDALALIVGLSVYPEAREQLRTRLRLELDSLSALQNDCIDILYLLTQDLARFPATTVTGGELRYLIVADKGEMGVRAVREAVRLGLTPVVVYSETDDDGALQVRLTELAGGIAIPLSGSFRESYANPAQIAERILAAYDTHFGEGKGEALGHSALYPGYGPLAENTQAIEIFRRSGIVFVGPSQDVVERAGDKRKFRILSEAIDPHSVTPGIVMDDSDPQKIVEAIEHGATQNLFRFPGRLKAANGGGGRGQVVIDDLGAVKAAVAKVLGEIKNNGWDQGVMFEQNIFETTHLEVQIVRDRFGNTRHFGMRDCTEQRASQKIQEEAPPALLRKLPELAERMCAIAVRLADEVGYVGACTVELMYKGGHFYLLEMNTRIQVEHPVTEEAHRIRRGARLEPLNLVEIQYRIAQGRALDFEQEDVVPTHVAREFRINAESYKPDIKDPRDGKRGLFLPNAGVFDHIFVPQADEVMAALSDKGVEGIEEVRVRFDCGFSEGDDLVNKDPTFGKLIVSVRATDAGLESRFELLRVASIVVIERMRIEGRQLLPNGKILEDRPFETNLRDHLYVLETDMLKNHCRDEAEGRHVNWLIESLRALHGAT